MKKGGSADNYAEFAQARNLFISSAFNMGWQIAIAVIIPIFIGVRADKAFDSAPAYTLVGFCVAIIAACLVVYKTLYDLNKEQSTSEKAKK